MIIIELIQNAKLFTNILNIAKVQYAQQSSLKQNPYVQTEVMFKLFTDYIKLFNYVIFL